MARFYPQLDARPAEQEGSTGYPIFRRNLDRHGGFQGDIDHIRIDPLGVYVDLGGLARAVDSLKQRRLEMAA
jgi:hypothetical protein